MRRAPFIGAAGAILGALIAATASTGAVAGAAEAARPNVIFDLSVDSGESGDVTAPHPEVRAELERIIEREHAYSELFVLRPGDEPPSQEPPEPPASPAPNVSEEP